MRTDLGNGTSVNTTKQNHSIILNFEVSPFKNSKGLHDQIQTKITPFESRGRLDRPLPK